MPRIRSIKPEFTSSEQVAACSPTSRLLFVELWMYCDCNGNHPLSANRLKAECFPYDDFDESYMWSLITELLDNGLIRFYVCEDREFLNVTGWHHQKITKPCVKYPVAERYLNQEDSHRLLGDLSPDGSALVGDHSPPDRRGEERRGPRKEVTNVTSCGVAEDRNPTERVSSSDITEVVRHYQSYHPKSKPGKRERANVAARLKEGYTVEELKTAIDGIHASPFHAGENSNGKKYQSLELTMRSSSHVQQFIEANANRGSPVRSQSELASSRASDNYLKKRLGEDWTDEDNRPSAICEADRSDGSGER